MYLDDLNMPKTDMEEQSTSHLVRTHSFSSKQTDPGASQASEEPQTQKQSSSSESAPTPSHTPPPLNLTTLIVCMTVVVVIVVSLKFVLHQSVRGYFCDDDSIRYPLVTQHVPPTALIVGCLLIPILVFYGVEAVHLLQPSRPPCSWPSTLRHFCEVYGVFVFGGGLCKVVLDVGKMTVGRLRPHFLQACKPAESCPPGSHEYVQDYRCTGEPEDVEEARLSFPSGHAALAFYTAVYSGVILRRRLDGRWQLPGLLAQSVLLGMAWFTALSRVQDYMHHPTDVAAGILLGTGWAVFVTCSVSDTRPGARGDSVERTNCI